MIVGAKLVVPSPYVADAGHDTSCPYQGFLVKLKHVRALRVLPLFLLLLGAGVLWLTRPRLAEVLTPQQDSHIRACQSNLREIALAFAHYAQDFDGKFPRGVDPEDRHPQTWSDGYGGNYADDANTAPYLHQVLAPYLQTKEVWRCAADVGWGATRENVSSRLGAVTPSSFATFGTSYYYYTIHGFAKMRPVDVPDPARELLLFDGDFWHRGDSGATLNAMFADGHVENLTLEKWNQLGDEQNRFLSTFDR